MRTGNIWGKILAWGLSIAIVSVWLPDFSSAQENKITENNVTRQDVVDVTENTTTYQLSDGAHMTVFHGEDVRFEDSYGNLVDYDPSLIEIEEQKSENGNPLYMASLMWFPGCFGGIPQMTEPHSRKEKTLP